MDPYDLKLEKLLQQLPPLPSDLSPPYPSLLTDRHRRFALPSDATKFDFSGIQEEFYLNLNGTPPSASLLSVMTESDTDMSGAVGMRATRTLKQRASSFARATCRELRHALISSLWILLGALAVPLLAASILLFH